MDNSARSSLLFVVLSSAILTTGAAWPEPAAVAMDQKHAQAQEAEAAAALNDILRAELSREWNFWSGLSDSRKKDRHAPLTREEFIASLSRSPSFRSLQGLAAQWDELLARPQQSASSLYLFPSGIEPSWVRHSCLDRWLTLLNRLFRRIRKTAMVAAM
jgi:hypothetical protein